MKEYTKPIYEDNENTPTGDPQPRGPLIVVGVAAVIGGVVSGCSAE